MRRLWLSFSGVCALVQEDPFISWAVFTGPQAPNPKFASAVKPNSVAEEFQGATLKVLESNLKTGRGYLNDAPDQCIEIQDLCRKIQSDSNGESALFNDQITKLFRGNATRSSGEDGGNPDIGTLEAQMATALKALSNGQLTDRFLVWYGSKYIPLLRPLDEESRSKAEMNPTKSRSKQLKRTFSSAVAWEARPFVLNGRNEAALTRLDNQTCVLTVAKELVACFNKVDCASRLRLDVSSHVRGWCSNHEILYFPDQWFIGELGASSIGGNERTTEQMELNRRAELERLVPDLAGRMRPMNFRQGRPACALLCSVQFEYRYIQVPEAVERTVWMVAVAVLVIIGTWKGTFFKS